MSPAALRRDPIDPHDHQLRAGAQIWGWTYTLVSLVCSENGGGTERGSFGQATAASNPEPRVLKGVALAAIRALWTRQGHARARPGLTMDTVITDSARGGKTNGNYRAQTGQQTSLHEHNG